MNYYEHHLGDYARDTSHLSMLEHGAYLLLLHRYYATEQAIPASQVYRLARARSKEEKEAVTSVLEEFFYLGPENNFHHKRADAEIEKAKGRIHAARSNGKAGGRPRKNPVGYENETQEKPSGLSVGYENETQPKALHTPYTSNQTTKPNPSSVILPLETGVTPTTPLENPSVTRTGELCKALRLLGIDAAPHLEAWRELLPAYSNQEIIAAATAVRDKKPGERIHLNYLLPVLRDRSAIKRAGPINGREAKTIAAARSIGLAPKLAAEPCGETIEGEFHAEPARALG